MVARVGAGVTRLHEGDRVVVLWLGWACGACEACASGWETLCPSALYTGYSVNGGFAEYVLADAAFAGRVPDSIDPLDAAPLTCAGVTTFKAVKVSRATEDGLLPPRTCRHPGVANPTVWPLTCSAVSCSRRPLWSADHLRCSFVSDTERGLS